MKRLKWSFLFSIVVGFIACAGLQTAEETLNSVELKGHRISVGMSSEKVRGLAGEPDTVVQGLKSVDGAPFTWWRYFGKSQDVNLKIDEAENVKEIIVTRYSK